MRNYKLFLILLICLLPATVFSTNIPVVSVLNYAVGPANMDGMKVSVDFADDTFDASNLSWGELSAGTYGVAGTGWSLTFSGPDTSGWNGSEYYYGWVLSTDKAVNGFTIDALPGNTVFDIIYGTNDSFNTTGSSDGFWVPNLVNTFATSGSVPLPNAFGGQFDILGLSSNYAYNWEFSNSVYVLGESVKTDLYSTLSIDLAGANNGEGFISGTDAQGRPIDFQFLVDTDNVVPIPEPATMLLFGFGLLGLGALGRRKP